MNVQSLVGNLRRSIFRQTAVRSRVRKPISRLRIEELERREVPAVIPPPIVDQASFRSITLDENGNEVSGWAPATLADPTNENQLVTTFVCTPLAPLQRINLTDTRVGLRFSTDGGKTWVDYGVYENAFDPKETNPPRRYFEVSNPSIAFDRFHNVFVTYTEHRPDQSTGRLIVRKFKFEGSLVEQDLDGNPLNGITPKTLYAWFNNTRAFNPNIAVDTNQPSFQDPTVAGAAGLQTDGLSAAQTTEANVRVFVTWNTEIRDIAGNIPPNMNPYVLGRQYSDDGALSFGDFLLVNDTGYIKSADFGPYIQSKTVFTPGRAGEAPTVNPGTGQQYFSGGRMVTLYTTNTSSDVGPNGPTILSDSLTFNTNAQAATEIERTITNQTINDGINNFTFTIPNGGGVNGVNVVDNISIALAINHNALADLRADLVAPNGTVRTLFLNKNVPGVGAVAGRGITGTTMGDGDKQTIFIDSAFFSINDGSDNATEPFRGMWQPELASLMSGFGGINPAGTWTLRITDVTVDTTTPRLLQSATLRIGQGVRNFGGLDKGTGAVQAPESFTGYNHPTVTPFAPSSGVGPGLVVWVDNTLGAFSPYQNRVYMAYSTGNEVHLMYSDGVDGLGGSLWNNAPIDVGQGYLPQLTVDSTTGTLAIVYYTTRYDASNTRSTMVLQTSVNQAAYKDRFGTIELSPASYITPKEETYDQIRTKLIDVEPIPSNGPVAGPEMWGNSVGLAAYNGRVNVVYTGNLNIDGALSFPITGNGDTLRTQNIQIAAGPRVVDGDMGPILGTAQVPSDFTGTVQYNGPAADGRNQFTGFTVEFDRVIDPASFTSADVTVIFRSPTDPPAGAGTLIPVGTVVPLDNITDPIDGSSYGSKRFFIPVTPQTAVGTYSYLIGADANGDVSGIADRVRSKIVTYTAPATNTFSTTGPPSVIQDYAGFATPNFTFVRVPLAFYAANRAITGVTVRLNVSHTNVSNLRIELIHPSGHEITLVQQGDAKAGANFTNTVFDDSSTLTLQSAGQAPPYTGSYRPAEALSHLFGLDPNDPTTTDFPPVNSLWFLRITDLVAGDTGTINSWDLTLTTAVTGQAQTNQNFIDQNGNGVENEPAFTNTDGELESPDSFSNPDPKSDVVFQLPYEVRSLPIAIPGPHLVGSRVAGQPQTTENLVKDGTTKSIDVEFDRTINASTFTAADVLRITGPLGNISLAGVKVTPITALNGAVTAGNSRFFRIEFTEQKLSGTYAVQLASQIADTDGNLLDTNTNAGVGNLVRTVTNADVTVQPYGGNLQTPVVIAPNSTVTVNLNVPDAYLIKRVTANLFITHANTRDLEGRLIAPDGTIVLLFVNAPQSGDPTDFRNTTFDDAASTPVQLGGSHFTNGSYNPIQPLAQLIDHGSKGLWKLEIKNKGALTGSISSFGLKLDKPVVGTGLGEEVADQTVVSFRISQTDPSSVVAKGNWSPIGPAPQVANGNDSTAGRVEAISIDPSDPSGNTAYAAGASGGVWRTTNFLTRDVNGPTWVPLTDFGPNNAINVGSMTVFNNTNDPSQTTIIVGTGSDDLNQIAKTDYRKGTGDANATGTQEQRFDGVGFLYSEDAGKTWRVLDSTNNYDPVTGTYRPFTDAGRDHLFVGAVVNRLVVETNVDVFSHRPIIYAAVGQGSAGTGAAGLWRSRDGGRTWTLVRAGEATDFQFGLGSQLLNSAGRPTLGYLALKGQGVFFSSNLDSVSSFTLMDMNGNNPGRPTVQQGGIPIPVNQPADTPNGSKGRIVIATPSFVQGDALANNYYQRWLYAAVAKADGTFDGLYMTKDRGYNWTKVKLTKTQGFSDVGTDDDFTTDLGFAGANHSLALAVDPNDPNIVYLGSDALIKIDTTLVNDPYNLSLYNHGNEFTGTRPVLPGATTDGPVVGGGLTAFDFNRGVDSITPNTSDYEAQLTAATRKRWNQLNMDRDPYNPFRTDITLVVTNTSRFNNDGRDVPWVVPGGAFAEIPYQDIVDEGIIKRTYNANSVAQILTIRDPITGLGRVIFGSDEGITSYVSEANGDPLALNGFSQDFQIQGDSNLHEDVQITGKRNGNLQVARLYSGDTQPSLLAASISQALVYGAARRMGDMQVSDEDVLGAGGLTWKGDNRGTRANYVAADQVGKGVAYVLRRVNDLPFVMKDGSHVWARTDFFQVSLSGSEPTSRTNGLFQNTADALGTGQWDNLVRTFAVNTIDADGVIMGSSAGRLFRTTDQGLNWNAIAEPTTLDGAYLSALTFGAPQPDATNLNDFIYAGSEKGNIWVSITGGGNLVDSWTNITAGSFGALDGSPVMKIVANPQRGSHELFAVTKDGIYHMADWTAAGAAWETITSNIKDITSAAFGNSGWLTPVLAAKDPLTSIAVDWRPTYGSSIGTPILYVGGDGGVFRATYNADATVWSRYTGPNEVSASDGGGLPVVKVTDVDLALGNVDVNTGRVIPNGSPDALIATTLGRGSWSVAIGVPIGFSGPKVVDSSPTTPQFAPISSVTIKFDSFISIQSFTTADVTITGPTGQAITPTAVVDITNPPGGQQNLHNEWRIDFPTFSADGTYTITVGPNILSGSAPMNQDGDLKNGETPDDQFVMKVIIGVNDLADYVKDSFQKLLGRLPTTTEFTAKTITDMTKARLAALGVTVKELLSTANGSEARQRLVERLFAISGGAVGEIGNLLPTYAFSTAERDFYVTALKNGTRSPESIAIDLIATTDATKGFKDKYFQAAGGNATSFLNQLYKDIYNGSGVQFAWVLPATQTTQMNQAASASGRLTLTRSLINGLVVKYYPGGNTSLPLQSIDFRTNFLQLAYQKYLGRAASAADVTAGKTLMAKPLAANSIQGSEWVYWKLLSSQEYFDRAAVQSESPALPDDGLHTDRGWVESVFKDRFYRTAVGGRFSTSGDRDTYSQKVLNGFKTQRQAFMNSIVISSVGLGLEYRDLKIKEYYQLVHARNPSATELTTDETKLKNGSTFPTLTAIQFATVEFYSTNAPQFAGGAPSPTTFARAVYLRLFNRLPTSTEEASLASKAGTVASRQAAVLAILNGAPYRDVLITADFQLFLGRNPSANELAAYQTFLKTHRWELLIVDLLANGAASAAVTTGLPREFWEVAN